MADTVDAHHKKKAIDLEAYAAKKKVDKHMQEEKEGNNKKKKLNISTMQRVQHFTSSRLENYLYDNSNFSYCSSDSLVSYHHVL
jgi:hypothetical protein